MRINRRSFLSSTTATALSLTAGGCGQKPAEEEPPDDPTKPRLVTMRLRSRAETLSPASVDISPDGKLAVIASRKSFRFWSLPDAREVRRLKVLPGGDSTYGELRQAVFFPDGKRVAALAYEDRSVRVGCWDVETGKEFPLGVSPGGRFALSPSGTLLAVAGEGIQVWDLNRSNQIHNFQFDKYDVSFANDVAFSPDEKRLAVAFHEGGRVDASKPAPRPSPLIRVWDLETRKIVFKDRETCRRLHAVAFSPNGDLLAAGGDEGEPSGIRMWKVSSSQLLHSLTADKHGVFCLRFHPRGGTLASCGNDSTIKLWDVKRGKLLQELEGHTGPVIALTFSKDGTLLLSVGHDEQILVWELERT